MSYSGRKLTACEVGLFEAKSDFHFVLVSGMKVNPCHHALLNIGGLTGYYVHIGEWISKPYFMNQGEYKRYLIENDKVELKRRYIHVPRPAQALLGLEKMLSETWVWWVIANNCVTFVEKIVNAGGAHFSVSLNCPKLVQ